LIDLKNQYSDFYRFHGRRISKKLSPNTLNIIENYFSSNSFDHEIIECFNNKTFLNLENKYKKFFLEIGFGNGEFLISNAKNNKNETFFIGSEVYLNGFSKVLKNIKINNLKNIKICNTNFIYLIQVLKPLSIDMVYFINPDPWPKSRHQKRRIINLENLNLIREKLKKNAKIIITTDSKEYFDFMLDLSKNKKLKFQNIKYTELEKDNELYGISNYQRKAIIKNQKLYYFEFLNN